MHPIFIINEMDRIGDFPGPVHESVHVLPLAFEYLGILCGAFGIALLLI